MNYEMGRGNDRFEASASCGRIWPVSALHFVVASRPEAAVRTCTGR
jgi:hypothetical protein